MLKKLYLLIGMALGALIVWAFTHEARKVLAHEREVSRRLSKFAKRETLELAMMGAVAGVDYLSDEYWEQELAQYRDMDEEDWDDLFEEDD